MASLDHAELAADPGAADMTAAPVGDTVTASDLLTACQDARNAQARYIHLAQELETARQEVEAAKTRDKTAAERRTAQLEQKDAELSKRSADAQSERTSLAADRVQLDKERKDYAKKDADLADRERSLREREMEAEAGFASKNREMLAALDSDKSALNDAIREARTERAAVAGEIQDARARWSTDQHDAVQKALARLQDQQSGLAADQTWLADEKAKLAKRLKDVELREQALDRDRRDIDADVAHAVEREHAAMQVENERLRARIMALTDTLTEREREVETLHTSQRRAKGRSAEELVLERDALQDKLNALEVELAGRPGASDLRRLHEMERTRAAEQQEMELLRQKTASLQLKADRSDSNAVELGELRSIKEAREATISILNQELHELNGSIDRYKGTGGPFPLCTRLDKEADSSREPRLQSVEEAGGLGAVADSARHHMALRDPALYYDERTVRLFLAGLATSHLALLEGISGTGKSSLPEAFAAAIGGVSRSIPVQASWRDRHDTLGHYNAFERQFAESDLLRHIYQAQLPAYADRPYLVILDEMNLARPEYYFADFLSTLEDRARLGDAGEVFIGLVDSELAGKPLPRMLHRSSSGISLRLPDNVWFVGTANQDESTLKFAPKTYDRAHVMELPRSPDRFKTVHHAAMNLSWTSLEQAFRAAAGTTTTAGTHTDAADAAWDQLTVTWEKELLTDFKLSWGNRLERQVRRFAPVLAAAGGTTDEAVDHILATKVLSRLKGRFDLDPDKLSGLTEKLTAASLPVSRALVEAEHRRIEA